MLKTFPILSTRFYKVIHIFLFIVDNCCIYLNMKIIKNIAFLFDISKNNRIFVTNFNISKNAF